jgi:hypothetical protein
MKKLIPILLIVLVSQVKAQDSVMVKVINKPFDKGDTTWYKVRVYHMKGIEQVWIWCCCPDKKKRVKGEMIAVAKKDLEN